MTAIWWRAAGALVLGGAVLVWPALLNGYPILFSDTGAFLHMTQGWVVIWDKPWIYGPVIAAFHWHRSLWPVVAAQGLILSWLAWLVLRTCGAGRAAVHLLACVVLAAGTGAAFSASLVMPDVFTGAVVLIPFLLALGWGSLSRGERAGLVLLGGLGVASHLSHLPVAGALAATALVLAGWRAGLRAAAPFVLGVALLLGTNLGAHGRLSLSPYGATFLFARLVANGSAIRTIEAECPAAGWVMCDYAGRLAPYGPEGCSMAPCERGNLPSDRFLWDPASPLSRKPDGSVRYWGARDMAPEAAAIVRATIRREPLAMAWDMLRDTWEQALTFRVGDTLTRQHVGEGVRPRVAAGFPATEVARMEAGAQWRDRLAATIRPLLWGHGAVAAGSVIVLGWLGWRLRRDRAAVGMVAFVFVGVMANAFATGALSGPHDRYGARVMWVLALAAVALAARALLPASRDWRSGEG